LAGTNLDASIGRNTISAFGDGRIDIRRHHIPTDLENVRRWRAGRFLVRGMAVAGRAFRVTTPEAAALARGARELVRMATGGQCSLPFT
jgi:hypothetical protein